MAEYERVARRMKPPHRLVGSVLPLLWTGCISTPLLRADFDSDPVGGLPSMNPPGDPVGDAIWIGTVDGGLYPPHAVEVVRDGAISGHSLRYSNIDISSLLREVRFYSRELTDRRPRYWATWVEPEMP